MTPVTGDVPRHLDLRIASDPAQLAPARRAVEAFAAARGLDAAACAAVGLCVNEALANVIRHAYADERGRPIELRAEPAPDGVLRITIRDWGNGVNPEGALCAPHDPLTPGGVGLICLRQLMDNVAFAPRADGMLLTMTRGNRP